MNMTKTNKQTKKQKPIYITVTENFKTGQPVKVEINKPQTTIKWL